MTYTTATLEISRAAFEEIKGHLERCGYQHAIYEEDGKVGLDMTHVTLVEEERGVQAEQATTPEQELETAQLRQAKDNAYWERNCVVAALARLAVRLGAPVGVARTDIPDWDPEWHNCVYIELPTGQVSWHFHDSQKYLFDGLPAYEGKWDGHDTPEKYRRVKASWQPPEPFSVPKLTALLDVFAFAAGEVAFFVKLQRPGFNYRNEPQYLKLRKAYSDAWDNVMSFFRN